MHTKTHFSLDRVHLLLTTTLIASLLLISGCSNQEEKLYLYAASSMSDVAAKLAQKFESTNPHIDVRLNSSGSGTLATQIINGAPWDVYISASLFQAENVAKNKNTSAREFSPIMCTNSLVLAVRNTDPLIDEISSSDSLEDILTGVHIDKIAMGNPGYVPAGDYAKDLLVEKQILDRIEERIIYASSVRQALGWLEAGEVNVAFIYSTDAKKSTHIKIIKSWNRPANRQIAYPLLISSNSSNESSLELFLPFLFSSYSEQVLRNNGFLPNSSLFTETGS